MCAKGDIRLLEITVEEIQPNNLPISSQLNLLAHTTPFVEESSHSVLDQTASELSSLALTHPPVSLL